MEELNVPSAISSCGTGGKRLDWIARLSWSGSRVLISVLNVYSGSAGGGGGIGAGGMGAGGGVVEEDGIG